MGRDWDITHAEDDDDLKEKGGLGHGSRCWSQRWMKMKMIFRRRIWDMTNGTGHRDGRI